MRNFVTCKVAYTKTVRRFIFLFSLFQRKSWALNFVSFRLHLSWHDTEDLIDLWIFYCTWQWWQCCAFFFYKILKREQVESNSYYFMAVELGYHKFYVLNAKFHKFFLVGQAKFDVSDVDISVMFLFFIEIYFVMIRIWAPA